MITKSIIVAGLVIGVANPAFARSYWVVKEAGSPPKCMVVTHKPTNPVITQSFKTRSAAEAAMQWSKACGSSE